jgi:hypothetical protein
MIRDMEKIGSGRKSFSLMSRPPRLFATKKRGVKEQVEVFEPYEENLPLEAGYYSFVLDMSGKFRVKRGNHSSHASFVAGQEIGAAGQFRINRAGNVAEVFCRSVDYCLNNMKPESPTVDFVLQSFRNHHALELSPLAIFHFKSEKFGTFPISLDKQAIEDLERRLALLDDEGQGPEASPSYRAIQQSTFLEYRPEPPQRLYGIRLDQMTLDLETQELQELEVGLPRPRLAPDQAALTSGKKAFVIDREGWLIVGHGHHLLSGGHPVGAAGQLVINPGGEVVEINLNFSGHYRPPLSADYARYTFRILLNHPLLTISDSCRITGRKFDESNFHSMNLKFERDELLADDPALDESIEYSFL